MVGVFSFILWKKGIHKTNYLYSLRMKEYILQYYRMQMEKRSPLNPPLHFTNGETETPGPSGFIQNSLLVDELKLQPEFPQAWRKLLSNIYFLLQAHSSLFELRSRREYFSPALGVILSGKITKKKHQNAKNIALSRPWKGHLITVWKLKWDGRVSPCPTSAGNVGIRHFKVLAALCMPVNDCEGAVSFDLWVTNTFLLVGEFANTESMNDED